MVSLSRLFGSFTHFKKIYQVPIISPALLWALVISLEQGNSADEKQFCVYLGLTLSGWSHIGRIEEALRKG